MLPGVIGVTGVCGPVGRRLVATLAAAGFSGRVVGIDTADDRELPDFVEVHSAATADAVAERLGACDAVVHLGVGPGGPEDPALHAGAGVDAVDVATAIVAALAARSVPSRFLLVTSARVYGAYPNNPVPLSEDSPLRPDEGAEAAIRLAEVERRLDTSAEGAPHVRVTVLRAAPVLGPGVEPAAAAALLGPDPVAPAGGRPVVQFLHEVDLAAALVHVLEFDLAGVYNVASPGWLTADEVDAMARRRPPRLRLRPDEYRRWLAARSRWSRTPAVDAPGYRCHPWVVSTSRLEATGFRCTRTNAEALRSGLERADVLTDRSGRRTRGLRRVAVASGVVAGALWLRRRSR